MVQLRERLPPVTAPPAVANVAELFEEHAAFVWRILRHFGVGESELEDQTQEVFLVVHRRRADFGGEHPPAWLYAICRRVASAYRRRSHRKHELAISPPEQAAIGGDAELPAQLDRPLSEPDHTNPTVSCLFHIQKLSLT